MTLKDLVFLSFAALTLGGSFFAVHLRRVFYNALSLVVALFGVAGLFIYLGGEFVAVMQIIVYVGAVAIAIIFAIMLSDPIWRKPAPRSPAKTIGALIIAGSLAAVLIQAVRRAPWAAAGNLATGYGTAEIGIGLMTRFVLAFEIISLVLLVAIIGALVISRQDPEKQKAP